jgi:hypothetical protein
MSVYRRSGRLVGVLVHPGVHLIPPVWLPNCSPLDTAALHRGSPEVNCRLPEGLQVHLHQVHPCEIRRLPLDRHGNPGVHSRYRRGGGGTSSSRVWKCTRRRCRITPPVAAKSRSIISDLPVPTPPWM